MKNFVKNSTNSVTIDIDTRLYSNAVICKTLYWYSESFVINHLIIDEITERLVLEKISGDLTIEECKLLKSKFSQSLLDYKLRSIIDQETNNIRDILYVKAFSNNNDFEDFNLLD